MKASVNSLKRMSVKQMSLLAMFCAISVVLVWLIHFPIIPGVAFLEYDPADIPIFIGTFLFGPWVGLILTVVTAVIQGVTVSAGGGPIGILMHIVATGSYVVVAGLLYRRKKTQGRAMLAMSLGVLAWIAVMIVWNILLTPIYMGQPREAVVSLLLPAIIPFNLVKAGANSIIAFLVYKSISKLVKKHILEESV